MRKPVLVIALFFIAIQSFAQKNVNFSAAYQKANKGKHVVEVNEATELLYIMIAMTPTAIADSNMTEHEGPYYQKVMTHFKPYSNEKIIHTIDSLLQASLLNYYFLSINSYAFRFNGNKLVPTGVYYLPAEELANVIMKENQVLTYKKEIEAFAVKSGYRKFYQSSKPYYDSVKAAYEKYAPIKKQWNWLEQHFSTRQDSYKILCSPLIAGMNGTNRYKDNGFQECLMFLPTVIRGKSWKDNFTEMLNTRIMFTEIDHNYVDAPSKKYDSVITRVLQNREKWVNTQTFGTQYYPNPVKVFNEYITFAVFLLYCEDRFKDDPAFLKQTHDGVASLMTERGFIKMKEFDAHLLELYKNSTDKNIELLYPALLQWCAAQ